MPHRRGLMPHRGSLPVALAALVVYAILCPPVSGMGDSSEFTLVLATHGVAHPTGYPLYTLFGHLFSVVLHALGVPWAFAANLWSAVGGAAAVGLLFAVAMELTVPDGGATRWSAALRILSALVPVSLFAFQPVVLGEATRAEVNSWSLAWACGAAFVFLRLQRATGEPGHPPSRRERGAAGLWGLVCGLGLAHHLTSVLISGPLSAGLIAIHARRRSMPSLLLTACAACLLPLAGYGIIAWRAWHPAQVQWPWLDPGFPSVLTHITGHQYAKLLGSFAPSPLEKDLLARAVHPFLFPGLALLLLGAVRARDVDRRIALSALGGAALTVTMFAFLYGVPDPAPYFMPAMAFGVAAAAPAIASLPGAGSRAGLVGIAATGLIGLLQIVPWLREGSEVREATLMFEDTIHSMWSAIPPDTAMVSWADDRFMRLREYQILRGEKPALLVVTPDLLFADSMRRLFRRRFGVDPAVGFRPPLGLPRTPEEQRAIDADRRRMLNRINERIRVPVIIFDPTKPIVWQMRKPWEPRTPASASKPVP